MYFLSPLEQFQILPFSSFLVSYFTLTNQAIIFFFILLFFFVLHECLDSDGYLYLPSRWQSVLEIVYDIILNLVLDNIKGKRGQKFFPFIFFIFMSVLSLNLIGLIPCSFTSSSQLIVVFYFSCSVFVGINIVCIRLHGIRFFSLFLPSGSSTLLAFLLVPIELISYIFKPISLSMRLFANMTAGHILLKVFAAFAFLLIGTSGFSFFLHVFPLSIIIPLFGLELAIALIQSYVFSLLICSYLNDAINLH